MLLEVLYTVQRVIPTQSKDNVLKYYFGKSESSIHTLVSKEQVEVHDTYIYMCVYTVHTIHVNQLKLSNKCSGVKVHYLPPSCSPVEE